MRFINRRLLKFAGGWMLLLLLALGGYSLYAWLGQGGGEKEPFAPTLELVHSYAAGTHTYTGTLDVPGCRNLSASYTTQGGAHPTIAVALSLLPETFCAMGETGKRTLSFGVGAVATSTPVVAAIVLDGVPLQFTVLEEKK